MIPRIQVGSRVCKPSGHGYEVGRVVPRVIKGRPSEEIKDPQFCTDGAFGIRLLAGQLAHSEEPLVLFRLIAELCWVNYTPGPYISWLRSRAKLSQRTLAKRAGISERQLRRIEREQVDPKSSTLVRLLRAVTEEVS